MTTSRRSSFDPEPWPPTPAKPAVAFRNKVVGNGFQNASIIEGCDGDLQAEAKTVAYDTTVECVKGKDDVGELEVVFGHRHTRAEAAELVSRAAASGFVGLLLEPDACGGFEVMIHGFQDRDQADDFVREARTHGFDAVIENS